MQIIDFKDEILPLLGKDVRILHPPRDEAEGSIGGGDLDCAVRDLDRTWPLRLDRSWRLLQCLRYDAPGWYWVLERDGHVLKVDTLDDPDGIGAYGFPTTLAITATDETIAAVRAAYLTSKRLRKGIKAREEWEHIRTLARSNPAAFASALASIFGRDVAVDLALTIERGLPPDEALWRRARRRVRARRIRGPGRAMRLAAKSTARLFERIWQPTGFTVVVAGPDGSGKSTLAEALPDACEGPFRRSVRMHWRPGILPRLSSITGTPAGDPTDPHGRSPHSASLSRAALGYYWLDFLLGHWVRVIPNRTRSGLVVIERGWWDMGVDPRRYRLDVSTRLVAILGRLLPTPDLVLVLEAPVDALTARKGEISGDEARRQTEAWRRMLPSRVPRLYVDATRPRDEVVAAAREAVFEALSRRAVRRLGSGWTGLPRPGSPRWVLPRGPRGVAAASPMIYQPVTLKGRLGWELARVAARMGAFRLLPRSEAPPREVRDALAPYVGRAESVATMEANHPGRYVVAVLNDEGDVTLIAKVATDQDGRSRLRAEASAIRQLAAHLPSPVAAPRVMAEDDGLLVLEAIAWRPRTRPWIIPIDVARACGEIFRQTASLGASTTGGAHGDLAPWNVLRTVNGWALVDWEDARDDARPFFDVFHYLVQAHALMGRPSHDDIVRGIRADRGWVGAAVEAYASAAGVGVSTAADLFPEYLQESLLDLDPRRRDARKGIAARRSLLDRFAASRLD
jgi:thymidylate kinase